MHTDPRLFRLPPSPPPSADATAPSSPVLPPVRPVHPPRALSFPSPPPPPPHKRPRSPHRFPVSLSSPPSSSSSDRSSSPPLTTAGIGRKVAESLQLFKESEEGPRYFPNSETALANRRLTTSHSNDRVAEARYEFVKRADWPDPETAALRRQRSSTTLETVRTREYTDPLSALPPRPLTRDPPVSDPSQWRKDLSRQDTIIRGRRRRRASDISSHQSSPITIPQSPCIRPCSRTYLHSPPPSRSPTDRIPPLTPYNPAINAPSLAYEPSPELSGVHLTDLTQSHSRSPTPTHTSPHAPSAVSPATVLPSPSRSFSPWSTDDESAWETSSIASDTSSSSGTSEHPISLSQVTDPSMAPLDEGEKVRASLPRELDGDASSYDPNIWNADPLNMVYGDSEESLPHIPLQPFRNQVGGHSAIYKFTKRAVCKPLVSRENQFYEAVERETPPLLGFIPRYLGVMLVTYRRVLRGSLTPPSLEPTTSFPVAPSHFSGSVVQRTISAPDYSFGNSVSGDDSLNGWSQRNDRSEVAIEEAELPEVVLDRNRHIIPEWLLHRGHSRDRACFRDRSPGSRRRLHPRHLSGATASSPALIQNQGPVKLSQSSSKRLPLTRQPTDGDLHHTENVMRAASTIADPRSTWRIITPEDNRTGPRDLLPFHSGLAIGAQQPSLSWFGGTGSTTVNTKLKDHIFSSILRRFHRRNGAHAGDEGEVSTRQGYVLPVSPGLRLTALKHYTDPNERLKEQENNCCTSTLRRVRSDSEMDLDGQNGPFGIDYDELGDFVGRERSNLALDNEDGIRPLFTQQRSCSRSVNSRSVCPSPVAPPPNQPISSSRSSNSVPRQHHFILMEDLTGRLKRSCVLDLKMGTRQYGMDATASKKRSQRKKCDRTTSRPLGIRVCGMQVWNHATQSYFTQNKYMGRDIRADEFPSLLASFLYDGEDLLIWHIPILLQKLYALAHIVSRLKGFRFYGCSLLLIYDGDHDVQEGFRLSAMEYASSRSKRGESLERSQTRSRSQVAARSSLRRTHSEDLLFGPISKRSGGKRKRGEVNVRVVDFAHTTTGRDWAPYPPPPDRLVVEQVSSSKGYQAEVDADSGIIYARFPPHYPKEPDRGFLFGLKNLTETLEKIWNDERMRRIKISRDDPSSDIVQLPALSMDGKDIFDEIFGPLEPDEDPGMLST